MRDMEICLDGRISDASTASGKESWIRVVLPGALVSAIMSSLMNEDKPKVKDIKLSWVEIDGNTVEIEASSLGSVLTDNIIDRYYNGEYINNELHHSEWMDDILFRYDNIEYWDVDVVSMYLESSERITAEDIALASEIIGANATLEHLGKNKSVGSKLECKVGGKK